MCDINHTTTKNKHEGSDHCNKTQQLRQKTSTDVSNDCVHEGQHQKYLAQCHTHTETTEANDTQKNDAHTKNKTRDNHNKK